jgi:integrase
MMLKSVARHWVTTDKTHLDRMSALVRRIDEPQRGLNAGNRARLRQLADPQKELELLGLPQLLMAEAQRAKLPYRAALLAQTAVAIEILLMAPVRLGNLVNLDLEQHLIRPGRKRLHIVIAGHEVKNHENLEFPLLEPSIRLIEVYITVHRACLVRGPSTKLFPGRAGGAKSGSGLREDIKDAVFRYTGLTIHPHLFRHIAALFYLEAHPGAYEVMRRVLGHRSMKTTMESYCGLETAAAARHFDEFILKLRGESDR